MITKIINFLRVRVRKYLNEEIWLEDYIKLGMKVGENCDIQPGLIVDYSHCWLIEIGNNVTIAPHVYLLAHDASTKRHLNYTKIGNVIIKDKVFIGARAIVMPGVTIGENSIIAAGSVVTKSIPSNEVHGGNPARFIMTVEDYISKQKQIMNTAILYDENCHIHKISDTNKMQMKEELKKNKGYVI